ncbi:IS3 family transposase [Gordonia sputi]
MPKPRRRTPNLAGLYTPSELVERAFTADAPNTLWCPDITEHPARDGKAYCCAVIDCFSRKVVGRAFSTTADSALVNNAVDMAVRERTLSGATVLHADHGTQFTSWSWGENLRRSGLTPSFGSVGDCFDNAAIEAFWGRMQVELLNTKKWATTFELVVAMANWIDTFYNTERVHSYVGNISPDHYEALWASTQPFQLQ